MVRMKLKRMADGLAVRVAFEVEPSLSTRISDRHVAVELSDLPGVALDGVVVVGAIATDRGPVRGGRARHDAGVAATEQVAVAVGVSGLDTGE